MLRNICMSLCGILKSNDENVVTLDEDKNPGLGLPLDIYHSYPTFIIGKHEIICNRPKKLSELDSKSKSIKHPFFEQLLRETNVSYRADVCIGSGYNFLYDFAILIGSEVMLVQIDDDSHFNYEKYKYAFDEDYGSFTKTQKRDSLMTEIALIMGYRVIRLKKSEIVNFKRAMSEAMEEMKKGAYVYVSNRYSYEYLFYGFDFIDPESISLN